MGAAKCSYRSSGGRKRARRTQDGCAVLYAVLLFAQEATDKSPPGPPWWSSLPAMLMIVVLFYLLMIAPARRESKQRTQLLSTLKKNDEVLTSSGIYGIVSSIKEQGDEVVLKIDDNARIRVLKSSIVRIISAPKEGTV